MLRQKGAIFYMFKFHRSYCTAEHTVIKMNGNFLQERLEKFLKTMTIKFLTQTHTPLT